MKLFELTGIKRDPYTLLRYERTKLYACTVLLTMNISISDIKKYTADRNEILQKIKELELEIQESVNPSQMQLF